MPTYVAFLRGINVGGHNALKMDELRDLVESLGHENVRTYIQSGNVVFEAAVADTGSLAAELHDAIEAAFGYDVTVMIRTRAELATIVDGQPFGPPGPEGVRHYVTFLDEDPTEDGIEALQAAALEGETFEVVGRGVYSRLEKTVMPDGRYTDAGSKLGVSATRRTWDVVTSVLELAS